MFVAVEGYRQKHHLHQPPKIGNVDEEPTMILFINEEKNKPNSSTFKRNYK
jgi:hypothetical protein